MKMTKVLAPRVFISQDDQYLFANGTHYEIYKKMGAHVCEKDGKAGTFFAVLAPNAVEVSVGGDFNNWQKGVNKMEKIGPGGIWTCFIEGVGEGALYKFIITTADGKELYKADPFANWAEVRPATASRVTNLNNYKWKDSKWMKARVGKNFKREPMAIYECHIGSFMRHPGREDDGIYTYREFTEKIVEYLKEMKYTHIELMGIAEHPFDGSWGYQVTGYYAPTARYGSPEDFMYLVDTLHKEGIGVILDWVPAHFATDAHGLGNFDGGCVFEHPDPRLGEHPEWGTKIFNYSNNEVKNFLIANVLFWMKEFHIDGIRVDAVASMLYLDYGKKEGQWLPNIYGGNKNLDAIEFLKHMNSIVHKENVGFITIAEESTAFPGITRSVEENGLGFDFKWNMGWMHDFCEYMKLDPFFRKDNHYSMTFAMSYNESESYILPLSHDEVVHLKCSMVNKMPGYKVDKYANLRTGYAYQFGHCGKKLLFMGQDFAQEREWCEERELDWYLCEEELNAGMRAYMGDLLSIYRSHRCMYEDDASWAGFEWLNADDKDHSVYTWIRKGRGKERLLFVLNMTPMEWKDYIIGIPAGYVRTGEKAPKLILNSDETKYGGFGREVVESPEILKEGAVNKPESFKVNIPPFSALIYKFNMR